MIVWSGNLVYSLSSETHSHLFYKNDTLYTLLQQWYAEFSALLVTARVWEILSRSWEVHDKLTTLTDHVLAVIIVTVTTDKYHVELCVLGEVKN